MPAPPLCVPLSAASPPEAGLGHTCLPGAARAQSSSGTSRGGLGSGAAWTRTAKICLGWGVVQVWVAQVQGPTELEDAWLGCTAQARRPMWPGEAWRGQLRPPGGWMRSWGRDAHTQDLHSQRGSPGMEVQAWYPSKLASSEDTGCIPLQSPEVLLLPCQSPLQWVNLFGYESLSPPAGPP